MYTYACTAYMPDTHVILYKLASWEHGKIVLIIERNDCYLSVKHQAMLTDPESIYAIIN